MPVHYLHHQDIDRTQWDALITKSAQRQVYALSWYLDVVSPGWEAVVEVDAAGVYTTVMPVPWKRKLGIRYVQQPLFCQQLGLYSHEKTISESTFRAFMQEVCQRFRYTVSYSFNTANKLPAGLPSTIQESHTDTHYLALHKPYAQLRKQYTRDRKMNLKRAQNAGLTVADSNDIEPIIQFFKEETADRIYGGVAETAYDQLRALYQALQERGLAKLLYTTDRQGRKNGGCLFMVWGGHIVYLFNAAPQHGRKQNGRTLMIDHMIQAYAGQEIVFDFESPSEHESAIVHFYKSFGPKPMPIPMLHYNRLPGSIRFLQCARKRLVRRLKGA